MTIDKQYWEILRWFRDSHSEQIGRLIDSISPDQVDNKQWLVDELWKVCEKRLDNWEDKLTIEIIGGWYGFPLIEMLVKKGFPIGHIRVVEMDPFCNSVIEKYLKTFEYDFKYTFVNEDILNIPEHSDTRKTRIVINTSCEHMTDMNEIIEKRGYIADKTIFAIQSNNKFDEPDHRNCCNSVEEFRKQSNLVAYYKEERDWGKYKRYMLIGRRIPVNFFTLKWGEKYGAEYVNRLYGSIKANLDHPFTFTCITDNTEGLRPEIQTVDYNTFDPFDYPKDRIFTREKAVIMKKYNTGQNVILDLDLLIHNDITSLVTKHFEKSTMIWNYWNWDNITEEQRVEWYGKGTNCFVNSSFVGWSDNNGASIYDHIKEYEVQAFHTYKSYDKYLYYTHVPHNRIDFWPRGYFYNYNYEAESKGEYQENKVACIFNTSHIKANNLKNDAFELDEAKGWVKELWESYDA